QVRAQRGGPVGGLRGLHLDRGGGEPRLRRVGRADRGGQRLLRGGVLGPRRGDRRVDPGGLLGHLRPLAVRVEQPAQFGGVTGGGQRAAQLLLAVLGGGHLRLGLPLGGAGGGGRGGDVRGAAGSGDTGQRRQLRVDRGEGGGRGLRGG